MIKESGNWLARWRVRKYKEDIDAFAHRNSLWARALRSMMTLKVFGVIARLLYDATIGHLERKFYQVFSPYEILEREGNLLLNSGIDEIWELVAGASANHFDNSNAQIGVGDDNTAAAAAQTDLQASTNKTYKAMEATYPTHTTQKITFKSSFGASEGNHGWKEWVVKQSTSAICLNRKVEDLGTKASGTWTLEVDITLS